MRRVRSICGLLMPLWLAAAGSALAAGDFSFERLGNLAYRGPVDPDHAITLRNGRYVAPHADDETGERAVVALEPRPIEVGDVDGDGSDDAVVVLTEDDGHGLLTHLAVVSRRGGRLACLDTAAIGRGVQVQAIHIQGGEIRLETSGDGAAERTFVLEDSGLAERTGRSRREPPPASKPAREAPTDAAADDDGELVLEPYPPTR